MSLADTFLAPLRKLDRRFWLTLVFACILAEGGELVFDRWILAGEEHAEFKTSVFTALGGYQRVVTAPRQPVVRHVSIVEIDPQKDIRTISDQNVCAEREFLAQLLLRIEAARPALIVVDKAFGRDVCPDDPKGTLDLIKAVQDIRGRHISVVVGRDITIVKAAADGANSQKSVITPSLSFGSGDQSSAEGIIRIAADNRQLPLQWPVYLDANETGKSSLVERDTLALAVAKLYDRHLLEKSPRLKQLIASGEQPFIGFLETEKFKASHFYASHVLCGPAGPTVANWRSCAEGNSSPPDLKNRIVLIAENDPERDEHDSIVGRIPGFYLQANYIEALLDDRYYRPGGLVLDLGFSFLFLLGLELILIVYDHQPIHAVVLVSLLALATYLVLYLVILHLGVYIDPWPIAATAILIKLLHLFYGLVHKNRTA
ncbi:MAG: CHASE2 domain-containing protein [Betaproteobacteria bacterium]